MEDMNPLPLTALQEQFLLLHRMRESSGPDPYVIQFVFRVSGPLDAQQLRLAAERLTIIHPCFRTAFLSEGKDWRDCGRPCDRHQVELRDRVGAEFPVVADAGCRNTVFNSVAQSAAEFLPRMQGLGLCHFRVELLRETAAQVGPVLERYARVLAGLEDGRRTWRQLQVLNQLGVTRGTLQMV